MISPFFEKQLKQCSGQGIYEFELYFLQTKFVFSSDSPQLIHSLFELR